ncbi:SsgA family sporulation/cell division regulator [Kitasatospora sp. NPDC085464]|uniref:SsgA family sporulation/cell division regulator n=1 Tax=Kitasatospora sp. NPDC085464 TaxID=3364063 RepID=UPI0037CC32F8
MAAVAVFGITLMTVVRRAYARIWDLSPAFWRGATSGDHRAPRSLRETPSDAGSHRPAAAAADYRPHPLPTTCRYSTADPYAVTLDFDDAGSQARWLLSRDLLLAGLERPAGDGDVHIAPAGTGETVIALGGQRGVALLHTATPPLAGFLTATLRLVPLGAEGQHVDWDAGIALFRTA